MFNLTYELKSYVPFDKNESEHVKNTLKFLKNNVNCFDRSNLAGHVTAGALVADKKGNVLLNHHKASGLWVQFGGHSDGNENSLNVAKREVFEESGIKNFECNGQIFDIAIYEIQERPKKHEPAHLHYDINFLFIVENHNFEISNESSEIKWVSIDEAKKLISPIDDGMQRMLEKYENYLKAL